MGTMHGHVWRGRREIAAASRAATLFPTLINLMSNFRRRQSVSKEGAEEGGQQIWETGGRA